jgi:hypothetical protein
VYVPTTMGLSLSMAWWMRRRSTRSGASSGLAGAWLSSPDVICLIAQSVAGNRVVRSCGRREWRPAIQSQGGLWQRGVRELELSPHNVLGVGDVENDHAFLCGGRCQRPPDREGGCGQSASPWIMAPA